MARPHSNRIRAGLETDLGCGSGILVAAVNDAVYDVLGLTCRSQYQRSEARHPSRLYRRDDIARQLRSAGLRAERLPGYGQVPFDPGLYGFLAQPG